MEISWQEVEDMIDVRGHFASCVLNDKVIWSAFARDGLKMVLMIFAMLRFGFLAGGIPTTSFG